jgi:hypothetical protein
MKGAEESFVSKKNFFLARRGFYKNISKEKQIR